MVMNAFVLLIFHAVKCPRCSLLTCPCPSVTRKEITVLSPLRCVFCFRGCDVSRPEYGDHLAGGAPARAGATATDTPRWTSVWRSVGLSLRCKCSFPNARLAVPTSAACDSRAPFCSRSADEHCTWYHALPHFKENMPN